MFTKEEIALAKPCYEAIKKISKGKWEWKPEVGDYVISKATGEIGLIYATGVTKSNLYLARPSDSGGRDVWMDTKIYSIPLLHWERIEEILEGMGYEIRTFDIQVKRKRWLCHIWKKGKLKKTAPRNKLVASVDNCKSRQEAVMRAVIELVKKV